MSTVVVVDIGNTSTSVALARNGKITRLLYRPTAKLLGPRGAANMLRKAAGRDRIDGSVLCSVVPKASRAWRAEMRRLFSKAPLVVSHRLNLGVKVRYPRPETIGADRLANACGAAARHGCPVIVADFGTATTFDVVSKDNAYVGGVIAPGLKIMTDYLYERTALLPRIELAGTCGAIGKNTAGAMRIGAKVGYRGIVREVIRHLAAGMGARKVKLCATGGYARWIVEDMDMPFTIEPDLTLYGLSRIFELNKNRA